MEHLWPANYLLPQSVMHPYRCIYVSTHIVYNLPYLSSNMFDDQAEHTGHLAVVREFEAGLSGSPDQDFVENKLVFLLDVNAFSIAKLLRGELTAIVAHMVLLKDGRHV